ncbi:MAG: TetR/AcrR family transcriptional regulator [Acutalibacteraceae bacterium]
MEKGNTKQEILNAALDLFSVQGFEATSISQIAGAVGIRKASLYNHFESKKDILDTLVKNLLEQYGAHSIFARADWDKDTDKLPLTPDSVTQMIQRQIQYIIHDPHISKARKLLVIEQFQNPELAKLQTKQNYSDVMGYFTGLMKYLIRHGVLVDNDPVIMAAQLCLPISTWINLCDREPDRIPEVMELVDRHIRQFFKVYKAV